MGFGINLVGYLGYVPSYKTRGVQGSNRCFDGWKTVDHELSISMLAAREICK